MNGKFPDHSQSFHSLVPTLIQRNDQGNRGSSSWLPASLKGSANMERGMERKICSKFRKFSDPLLAHFLYWRLHFKHAKLDFSSPITNLMTQWKHLSSFLSIYYCIVHWKVDHFPSLRSLWGQFCFFLFIIQPKLNSDQSTHICC